MPSLSQVVRSLAHKAFPSVIAPIGRAEQRALALAIQQGRIERIKPLLDAGADLDKAIDGLGPYLSDTLNALRDQDDVRFLSAYADLKTLGKHRIFEDDIRQRIAVCDADLLHEYEKLSEDAIQHVIARRMRNQLAALSADEVPTSRRRATREML